MQIFRPDGTDEGTIDVPASVVRWSPAGDRIAYSNGSDVYTVRPDGTDDTPVRLGVFDFAWAPDGTRLALVTEEGVRVVDADGGNDVLVFPGSDAASPSRVAWSPSGNKLAVVTAKLDLNNCCPGKVVVMNVDGSGAIDVTGETTGVQIVAIWRP